MECERWTTKFYEYYLKRVKPEYQDAAQHLLKESFKRQADGNFDDNFINKLLRLKFILKQIN